MIHYLIQYIMLALGLMASLFLYLTLKRELQMYARKQRKRLEEMAQQVREASDHQSPAVIVAAAARSGMNVSRRVQALRMLRRGEDVSHVAAALGLPRQEVELLIRVQALVNTRIVKLG
jgi:biopolymer transport protein ExbB/TolQ